ncbi:MAG: hypothetical protein ABS911_07185 [Carnobacterium sp.]|uniref:hypothetical protein n=1 Tax=Carnobacterium sp. TaxID=48221 RepID=UPI0033153570
MTFEPTESLNPYYNESLLSIDEKICDLLNQRKEVLVKNTIFPPDEVISRLANEYDLQEEYLQSLFTTMAMEASLKPMVVPIEFKKYVPVLKTYENQGVLYTVTYIRQYSNASVLYLHIDWEERNEAIESNYYPDIFDMFIDDTYICRSEGGGGTTGHTSYSYIISPALPDDITGIELIFTEPGRPFKENPTGFEFTIKLG